LEIKRDNKLEKYKFHILTAVLINVLFVSAVYSLAHLWSGSVVLLSQQRCNIS